MHARHVPETIFYRWAIRELATVLACEPTTEAVLAARGRMSPAALDAAKKALGDAVPEVRLAALRSVAASPVRWNAASARPASLANLR